MKDTYRGILMVVLTALIAAGTAPAQWVNTNAPNGVQNKTSFFATSSALYVTCNAGIFRTTDFGATWAPCDSGLMSLFENCRDLYARNIPRERPGRVLDHGRNRILLK